MHGAAIGHAVQLLALFIGEHTLEGQLDIERVSAFLLFSAVVGDFHGDAGEGNVFFLGIQFDGQRLARGQGGIEIVVGGGRRVVAAQAFGQIGEQFVVIDIHTVAKVVVVQGVDGNRHGEPHRWAG